MSPSKGMWGGKGKQGVIEESATGVYSKTNKNSYLFLGMLSDSVSMENIREFMKKIIEFLIRHSGLSSLHLPPKQKTSFIWKKKCTLLFIVALSTIARICKQCIYTIKDKWLKKVAHTYNGISWSSKKR